MCPHVFLLGETLGGLSECPDATVVIGDLGDDILGVLREVLYDYRFGFLAGVRGEIRPWRNLASEEKGDVGDGWVGQCSEIRSESG